MHRLPGKFVWFEHVGNDTGKARAFYEALCGWTTQAMPMGEARYEIICNGEAGIGGYRQAAQGEPAHWASYLSVEDVDQSFAAALAAGAKAVAAPMDYGTVGRGAVLADPTGALLRLWRGASDDPADTDKAPVGGWCWNELQTTDAQAAAAFHTRAFGFTQEAMDMGPMGTYTLLKDRTGRMRGGIVQQEAGMQAPSHWLPYIEVADCDAATARAMQLGARQTLVAPMDVEMVGRFSVVMDPFGAPIGLIKSAG